jgi:hypothetical protein
MIGFVPAFGDEVEVVIGGVHHVEAARVAPVGVEDRAAVVLCKDADAFLVGAGVVIDGIVVGGLAARDLFGLERDVEVVVEIAAGGRQPLESPAQALRKSLQLGERRPRDGDQLAPPSMEKWMPRSWPRKSSPCSPSPIPKRT